MCFPTLKCFMRQPLFHPQTHVLALDQSDNQSSAVEEHIGHERAEMRPIPHHEPLG